jgi:hypothetical protein
VGIGPLLSKLLQRKPGWRSHRTCSRSVRAAAGKAGAVKVEVAAEGADLQAGRVPVRADCRIRWSCRLEQPNSSRLTPCVGKWLSLGKRCVSCSPDHSFLALEAGAEAQGETAPRGACPWYVAAAGINPARSSAFPRVIPTTDRLYE